MVLLNLFTAVSTTSRILSTSGFIVVAGKLQICKKKHETKKTYSLDVYMLLEIKMNELSGSCS